MYLVIAMKQHTVFTNFLEKSIYLLLLSNSENSCYVLIKDFNRFITNKTKPHGKKHFVDIAYYAFLSSNYWNVILKVFWQ